MMELPDLLRYILKSTVFFTVLYLFYLVLLKKVRSFGLGRVFLLFLIGFSMIFPAISITRLKEIELLQPPQVGTAQMDAQFLSSTDVFSPSENLINTSTSFNFLLILYVLVCSFLLLRLLVSLVNLSIEIDKQSRIDFINGRKVFITQHWRHSFTFFGKVVVSSNDLLLRNREMLVDHEIAHAREMHSFDILLAELFQIIHWFNPLAYLLKPSIIENHEFIADRYAIRKNNNTTAYQRLILDCVSSDLSPRFSSSFSAKLLKKRIAMITTVKHPRPSIVRYVYLIPVIALLFMLMSFHTEVRYIYSEKSLLETNNKDINDDLFKGVEEINSIDENHGFGVRELPLNHLNKSIEYTNDDYISFKETTPVLEKIKPLQSKKFLVSVEEKQKKVVEVQVEDLLSKLKRVGSDYTFLKDFYGSSTREVRYSIILKKGLTYRFYLVANENGLINQEVILYHKEKNSEAKVVEPKSIGKTKEYSFWEYLIDKTDAYHLYIPEFSNENDFLVGLYLKGNSSNETIQDKRMKPASSSNDSIYLVCDELPDFKHEGYNDVRDYIQRNIIYPKVARDKGIQGRVFVQFVVNTDGIVSDVQVVRGSDSALNLEAQRVIEAMPNWIPGKQDGKPVRISFTVPVVFSLENSKEN